MIKWTGYGVLTAGALVAAMLGTGTAAAQPRSTPSECLLNLGSVTAGGDHRMQTIQAEGALVDDRIVAKDIYPDGQVRLSATFGTALPKSVAWLTGARSSWARRCTTPATSRRTAAEG